MPACVTRQQLNFAICELNLLLVKPVDYLAYYRHTHLEHEMFCVTFKSLTDLTDKIKVTGSEKARE